MSMENTSNCWTALADVIEAGIDRVLLYGPPGTGKTYAALTVGTPTAAFKLVCTEDLTSADLTGMWRPNAQGGFDFFEGPAIQAWTANGGRGGRLVVDEADRASGDVLSQLLAMTDSPESARWEHPLTGEVVRPGPQFSVIMTSNIEDPDDLPVALADRFPVRVHIDQPPAAAVERLSADLRAGALYGTGDDRLALRSLYAFETLRKAHGDQRAAQLVFGKRAEGVLDSLAVARVGR